MSGSAAPAADTVPAAHAKSHGAGGGKSKPVAGTKAKAPASKPKHNTPKANAKSGKAQGAAPKAKRQAVSAPTLTKTTADSAPARPGKTSKAKPGRGSAKKVSAAAVPSAPAPVAGAAASSPASAPTSSAPTAATTPAPAATRLRRAARRAATRRRAARRVTADRAARAAARASLAGASNGPLFTAAPSSAAARGTGAGASRRATERRQSQVPDGEDEPSVVTRTVRDIVEVVPGPLKAALLGLALLSAVLGGGYLLSALRARRLARQRADLVQDVGLLQTALLPPVPAAVGALRTSVAYRPSEGPGAGGDFYDALPLPGGKAAFILGDVCGHGRQALARTAFVRYTLRAYLEAGLEPSRALQVGAPVIDQQLGGSFATVILAVHDPAGGSLTYACAGHPAPIVVGPGRVEPVSAGASPPLGLSLRTGVRQTTVPLPPGSVVCLYTDGLAEARSQEGLLGRARLADILHDLGRDATADALIDRVAAEACLITDDMATVVLSPTAGVTAGAFREERLEVDLAEVLDGLADEFLTACGVDEFERAAAVEEAQRLATSHAAAVLQVRFGTRGPTVGVLPRDGDGLAAPMQSAATA